MADNYREEISRIEEMNQIIGAYSQESDLVQKAEIEYERLRTLNQETLLRVDLEAQALQTIGNLSVSSLYESGGESAIGAALNTVRSTTLARAVGPIEELPLQQYEDSIRRKIILSDTQVGAEHGLVAKLSQMRGNTYYPVKQAQDVAYANELANDTSRANASREARARRGEGRIEGTNVYIMVPPPDAQGHWKESQWVEGITEYSRAEAKKNVKIKDDIFPFKIKNLASGKSEPFPAYIESLNESVSVSWNSVSFVNRSEDLYVYNRAERSFTLDFWVFATHNNIMPNETIDLTGYEIYPTELSPSSTIDVLNKELMWKKINFLHRCTRPQYTGNKFAKAPYCKLWIGNLYNGITSIIDGINLSYDPLMWDLNPDLTGGEVKYGGIKPMIVKISMTGKFLHGVAPSVDTYFYDSEVGNA